jgi:hypothetical protein
MSSARQLILPVVRRATRSLRNVPMRTGVRYASSSPVSSAEVENLYAGGLLTGVSTCTPHLFYQPYCI